jgi:hypothetical protein
MGSRIIDVESSSEESFLKIQEAISSNDYTIKSMESGKSMVAEGGRMFSWLIVVALVILIWPIALVYYFTRQRSSVSLIITDTSEKKCKVSINSNGISADYVMDAIVDKLNKKMQLQHMDDPRRDEKAKM